MFVSHFVGFKSGMKKGSCLCSHSYVKSRIPEKIDRTIKGVLGSKGKWIKPTNNPIEHETYLNHKSMYDLYYVSSFSLIFGSRIFSKSYWDEIGEINIKDTKWYNKVYQKWVKSKMDKKWSNRCENCGKRLLDLRISICRECDKRITQDYFHSFLNNESDFGQKSEFERNMEIFRDYIRTIPRFMLSISDYRIFYYLKTKEEPNFRYWS